MRYWPPQNEQVQIKCKIELFKIYNTVCGHHESGFELRYHYQLMPSKKRNMYNFEFRLAPGTIVGQVDFRLNLSKSLRMRSNIEQGNCFLIFAKLDSVIQ